MHVLVIEDAAEVAQLIKMVLRRDGVSQVTLCVNDFENAYECIDWSKIDVVISDRQLDGHDGCLILAQLERSYPEIGRIMLTADVSAPFDDCHAEVILAKPISIDRLTAAIATVTDARK